MAQEQLRIDHDDDPMDIMESVNEVLEKHGLTFRNDGQLMHDGYEIYTLTSISASSGCGEA